MQENEKSEQGASAVWRWHSIVYGVFILYAKQIDISKQFVCWHITVPSTFCNTSLVVAIFEINKNFPQKLV
jgi:hypothetical protein